MLLLSSTEKIKLTTSASCAVNVSAHFVDHDPDGAVKVQGVAPQLTSITTATTTDIVAAPASGTMRSVKTITIRNTHATDSIMVTVILDGSIDIELEERTLGPGQSLTYEDKVGFVAGSTGGPIERPWFGYLAGALGDGNPDTLMDMVQDAGNVAPTPTNISTSIARCCMFMLPFDLTVNTIRYYGVGATTNVYRVAIYRYDDLARLMAETAFTTTANAWGAIGGSLALNLTKNTRYFIACSVNATGTTAGIGSFGGTIAATTGQVQSAPGALPGSLATLLGGYCFQFAVTTGALPNPAATLAAQAAWTGGMPAFWLDNA